MSHYHHHISAIVLTAFMVVVAVFSGIGSEPPSEAEAATNITVSGIIYNTDPAEYDCSSDNLTVRVVVNGGTSYTGTCTLVDGTFSVTNVSVDPSDILTIYLDNETPDAVAVTRVAATPADITGIPLTEFLVLVRHEDAGPLTNANLDLYDSGQDADIPLTVSSGALTLPQFYGLEVGLGDSFNPGGPVNLTDSYVQVDDNAVLTLSGGTSNFGTSSVSLLSGSTLTVNSDLSLAGIFAAGTATVTTSSGTPTITATASIQGGSGSMTFHNLAFAGTFSQLLTSSGTITVNGNISVANASTLNINRSVTIAGNLTTTGTGKIGTTSGTPTVSIAGSTIGGGTGDIIFYGLTKTGSGTTTWTGSGVNSVTNTLTLSAGSLTPPTTLILGGALSEAGGTLGASSGTVIYANTSNQTVGGANAYNNLVLSDGLVGYWKLDETAGTASADSSGFAHNGTHTASPTISSDIPTLQYTNDRSLDLNGSSQYVDLGDPTYLDGQFGNKITVSAWIKADVSKNAVIVGKSNNASHSSPYYNYSLFQSGNILSWRVGTVNINSSGSGTGALVIDGTTWQHVAGTYDGTTLRSYINGIEVSTGAQTGNVPTSDQNARIGARHTTSMDEFFNGKIDEARIYRRTLSAQEIRALAVGNHPGGSGATYTLSSAIDVNNDFTLASGTLDVDNSQNYAVTVAGNFRNFGALQPRSGNITLDGTSSGKVIETGQQHFNNLTVAGSGGEWTLRDRLWVNGTLSVSNGTLDVSTNNYNIHTAAMNQTGGTVTPRSGSIIFDSGSGQTLTATSALNAVRVEDASESNLAGYWKLDELSGTVAKDWSGNDFGGTLSNAPAFTTSLNSTTVFDNVAALDLDGTDDYVAMGDVIDTNDTADLTLFGWFNRDTATTDDVLIAKRNGNTAGDVGYVVWLDAATDKLRFEVSDGTDEFELASTTAFTSTGWNRFAIVWDQDNASNSEIYINGVDDNATQTGTIGNVGDLSNALSFRIGAESDTGAPFDGKVDDVRIYTTVLTATPLSNLAAGRYADGSSGTATVTLGGNLSTATLALDSGTLATSSHALTVTNALTLTTGNGTYSGGSATQTMNGGLTVSGSTFTGGAGTLDINGSVVLSGGTVTTGAGNWQVSGSFTHSGSTFTATAGNTLTMDGTGTLTSNGQALQNLSINSSGTVTLAAATHTVSGNLLLGGSGTPTVTSSVILMNGTGGNTIDGGGKTLNDLTIDPSSNATITLQNSDLTVSGALSVAANDVLGLNSGRTLTLSGNTGTTLTLNGTINGSGRLTYQNSATTFPTTGTIASILRFDMLNNPMTVPDPTNNYGGTVEIYNSTGSSRTATLSAGSQSIGGSLLLLADGSADTVLDASANPTVSITGDLDYTGVGGGIESITSGTGTWTVAGHVDFTAGTYTATSGNTLVMTGTKDITSNNQSLSNFTVDGNGTTVRVMTNDLTVSGTLTIGGSGDTNNDTLEITSGLTVTSGTTGAITPFGSGIDTISGAGLLTIQNSSLGSQGTLSVSVRYDATNGNIFGTARTYNGNVEIYNNSAVSSRTVTLNPGGIIFSGNLTVNAANSQNAVLATTGNPTVNITGDFDFTGVGAGNESFSTGSGVWTISGNVDLEGSSVAPTISSLTLNGAGNTLRANNRTVSTLTFAGTTTITSTNVIVGTALNVNASSTATIDTGRTMTSGSPVTINSTGTIDGAGTLALVNNAALGATGTISSNVDISIDSGDYTIPNRTFSGSTRTVRLLSEGFTFNFGSTSSPITFEGNLTMDDTGCGGCEYSADLNDPNITVGGNVTFASPASASFSLGGGTWSVGGNFDMTNVLTLNHNSGMVTMTGTAKTLTSNGKTLNNVTSSGTIAMSGATTLAGDLTISGGTLTAPAGNLTVAGNFDNNATFTHNSGTLLLNAGGAGRTIEAGSSPFYNLTVNNASGSWTLQTNDATIANNLTLTAATGFTVQSGRTVTVQGQFSNAVGGSATTWTGSTLNLSGSHSHYEINTKTGGSDTYGTLVVGNSEHIGMWNSDAAVFTATGGSILSQDHAAVDGRLNVYGTASSRSNEYWAYATDFDGAALGLSRQADVRFANGASLTVDSGDTLNVLGQNAASNRSLVTRQSSGSYALTVNGTINAQYYSIQYLSAAGLVIGSTATVSELSYGTFDNSAGGVNAAYISVTGITSTKTFNSVVFDTASDGTDSAVTYNVSADGSGIAWSFVAAAGNRAGATFEHEQNGASIIWSTLLNGVNDGTASDVDTTTVNTELSANWSVNLATDIDHYMYAIGTSSGASDVVAFTSNGLTTSVTHPGLSLSSGTNYYVTVRARNAQNEIIVQASSDGVLVDTSSPSISNVAADPSDTTAAITWTTNEGASSRVEYGLTNAYGSTTATDPTLVTSHSVALTGLAASTTYHFRVISLDVAGNSATSSDATFTTDGSAPVSQLAISNVRVIAGETIATVLWTTDEASTSRVRYGRTEALGNTVSNATAITSHQLKITGLSAGTRYYYEIESIGSTVATTPITTFVMNTPESRLNRAIAPTLFTPLLRDGLHPTITVTGVARGGDVVRIYVDSTVVARLTMRGVSSQIKPFSARIQLDDFENGRHTLYAQSTDTFGRTSFINRRLAFRLSRSGIDRSLIAFRPRTYLVEPGDSLWKIAERYLGDGRRYLEITNANIDRFPSLLFFPTVVLPGWVLRIPSA